MASAVTYLTIFVLHISVNSTCSTGSKYDVDLLRVDVGQCKARVTKLKRELAKMDAEVSIKQKGMETLARVKDKYSEESNGLTLEEARAIKTELNNIQKSLTVGEQEKIELMKNLACLKDDLTRLQHSESTLDVTKQSQVMERLSTASQTDLSGELVPVGARLAEMARIRLQYDETRQQVQDIQQVRIEMYLCCKIFKKTITIYHAFSSKGAQ